MAGPKKSLRFRAGEVGFVFYEESAGFPGMVIETTTFAFSTIGEAATWLKTRFEDVPQTTMTAENMAASDGDDRPFREAQRALMGQRWTAGQAEELKYLVRVGAGGSL